MEGDKTNFNNFSQNNNDKIILDKDEEFVLTDTIETGKTPSNEVTEELMAVDLTNKNEKTQIILNNQKIKSEQRKVMVPSNRMKPLKDSWATLVKALVVRNNFFF